MEKMNGETLDLTKLNIEKLKELFPNIVTENKIDFDKLRLILGDEVGEEKEKYQFTWPGKRDTIKFSQQPTTGTLRPCKEESVEFDKTDNLYIEGDNLEVLKILQKSYFNKIDVIYIDPPYNTGKDFVYKDNFRDSVSDYKEKHNNFLISNPDTSGRYHTNWLNMLYSRLSIARNLLTNNGVIFISIDDNELNNLLHLCNEIFGEKNVDVMIWRKTGDGRDGKMKNTSTFRKDHEYIIVCYKNEQRLNKIWEKPNFVNKYPNPDNDPRGPYKAGSISRTDAASNPNHKNYYTVTSPTGKNVTRQFDIKKDLFEQYDRENRIYWGKNGDAVPSLKIFVNEKRFITPYSVLSKGSSTQGKKEFFDIFGHDNFETPKPIELCYTLIQLGSKKDSIILDFFSGSGTTADAICKLNNDDQGDRKFIMVQLPEQLDQLSESYKSGFNNICDIGKERIKRTTDRGFKNFKLDSTNLNVWDSTIKKEQSSLFDLETSYKSDRTKLDVVFEIILKQGLMLTETIEEISFNNKILFNISNYMVVCLEKELDESDIEYIANIKYIKKVILLDSSLTNTVKLNADTTFKSKGIEVFNTL